MYSLKHKLISFLKKTKQSLGFFVFFKSSGRLNKIDINKKLVYSLSPRKIPSGRQFKYLNKFLNPRENLILKICLLIIAVNLVYLGFVAYNRYLENTPIPGGTYVEGVVGYPRTINPLYASSRDVDNDLSRLMYSSLFKYNEEGHLEADLVENYTISEDKKGYELLIKDNVNWHNEGTLTADDIIFTFNLIQNENYNSPLRNEFVGISIEKINDRSVRFTLPEPYAPFLDMLTFGIMPKAIWQDVSPEAIALNDFNLKPVGSGPYKFKGLLKNRNGDLREYQIEVHDDYYTETPYIDTIIFRFFSSHIEAIENFNSGNIDGLSVLPFSYRTNLESRSSIEKYQLLRPQISGLFFNLEKDFLQDVEVRKALARAINKPRLNTQVYSATYETAWGPILKNSFAYNEQVEEKNTYLPDEARATFEGVDLNITITAIDVNGNRAVAETVKGFWEELGVTTELRIIPLEQALDVIRDRDFEVLLYGQLVGGDPDVYAFWHSSQTGAQGLNISGYSNDEVDTLLTEARTTVSESERIEKYHRFQTIITDEVPAIFLYSPSYTYIHSNKINGFKGEAIVTPADRFSQISDWYIKTKKTWAK